MPFAKFLLSHASENRFFGTIYFVYNSRPNGFDRMRIFFHPAYGWPLVQGLLIACGCAIASTWVGLVFGRWIAWGAAMKPLRPLLAALIAMLVVLPAYAHVGNKDVFQTIVAGPYKLFVTVPPLP